MTVKRLLAVSCALAMIVGAPARASSHDPASEVDPFIGTLGSGFVFPGPAAPYGMVQLSPDTEGYFAYTGYMWIDQFIRGFSHVHVQSMGVPEGGQVPFMPTVGPIVSTDVKRYQSKFNHATEDASPGYYRVGLDTYGITAELTAGERVGMHRYTFPPVPQANVLLDIGRQIPGGGTDDVQRTPGAVRAQVEIVDDQTIVGTSNPDAASPSWPDRIEYAVHFAARFDRPFDSTGVWSSRGAPVAPGTSVDGVGAGAAVTFDATGDTDVVVKVGISFTSRQGALDNLESELPGDDFGFDALRARTYDAWSDALSVIEVEGGTPAERVPFTTALYHAQHHPNVFSDADGSYLGHDGLVHQIGAPGDPMPAGSTYYANFSLWDTYRAEKPLLMLIAPDRFREFMYSFGAIVRWGGRLPRWSLMNKHADFMNGEPALQVLADAFCRGLVPADVLDTLYDDGVARALDADMHRNRGFVERGWVDPSTTLEHALGNFALALVADARGLDAERDALLGQAAYWRNVLDPETKFVRPRNADGSWVEPYFPENSDGFVEGTGWQYTWLVPHDVDGLFDAIGADTLQRLDTFFATALTGTVPLVTPEIQQKLTLYGIAYYGNQYAPSNEHDLQAPWLYNWTAEPWKTQALQRAYQGLYRAAPDGLPGNDDLGTMSAWLVWSMLGFYPMIPGAPVYTTGSPAFERATIQLPNDATFVIEAPGASIASKYVQSATLDGDALDRTWFAHDALADGGTITFQMGAVPSLSWGVGAPPPSQSTSTLDAFGCTP